MFESYAQNFEDVVLWRVFRHVERGTYVDVGAADPDEDSVTKAFYERGWTGVNVEPAAEYAARLRSKRPNDVTIEMCAGAEEGVITLHQVLGTGLSSVVDGTLESLTDTAYEVVDVEVPVRRLDDILADAGLQGSAIHFLKIDVEGFEESVLRGLALERWRPWVIVAESTLPRSPTQVHHRWEPLLLDAGYEFCLFDGLNRFYLAGEHAELRAVLSAPANVFDQPFVTTPHANLLREYDSLLEGHARLENLYKQAANSFNEGGVALQAALDSYGRLEEMYHEIRDSYERLNVKHRETIDGYDRLEVIYQQTLDAYSHLEVIYQTTVGDYERIDCEMQEHIESSRLALEDLERDRSLLLAERATLRSGVAKMGQEIDGIRYARDLAEGEVDLLQRTISWRITRPLRVVRRLYVR